MDNTAFNGDAEGSDIEKSNDIQIDIGRHERKLPPTEPYAGMNKEDLLRFSQTPFWNRLRMICLILFWLAWLSLLAAVIVLTIILPRCQETPKQVWWQKSVFYQVYVRSFQDSDGDGNGDLKGLESRLDYIKGLNADSIILSSVLDSGSDGDIGYEVKNYTNIDALFGSRHDFDALIKTAHSKDLKVVMDFVPNFTGKDHPWFVESSSSADPTINPYWNYYVWADCAAGLPTNWRSVYNQPAWTYNATIPRNQCYLNQFLPGQPELNLRSTGVQEELKKVLRFWLDRGVDGFRVNSVAFLFENEDLRNDTYNDTLCTTSDVNDYNCYSHENTKDLDIIHTLVSQWKDIINLYPNRVLITDARTTNEKTVEYYSQYGSIGADLPLYYGLHDLKLLDEGQYVIEDVVHPWLDIVGSKGTTDWLLDYQDASRVTTSTSPEYAKALTVLSMTLPGVPIMYYGQEIGMVDGQPSSIDPAGDYGLEFSRDPYRSPMQWNDQVNAGFTNDTADPYLTVNNNMNVTVQAQEEDVNSLLNMVRSLALLHKEATAFQYGYIHLHTANIPKQTLAFIREYDGTDRYLVIINMSNEEVTGNYRQTYGDDFSAPNEASLVFKTGSDVTYAVGDSINVESITIPAYQGLILTWEYTR